ncbi:hypothetical protein [Roseibium salinum]|uniref:Aa3 type cytochrome c oxidase subunit IV n=1 Tax=Roseibium salinum TaxID=1604349 RepID=A0ABT3R331_9HYPH|nr:hypothetical protein [Roseibium sp. DSM 29163]MCX2723476.1 hypothetical protein [Roseibium sp. DSM 29163]
MAKAITAASEASVPEEHRDERAGRSTPRDEMMNVPGQIAKNLLFWGSIVLTIYALYALVAAL